MTTPAPGFNMCESDRCTNQIRKGGYRWCMKCRADWGRTKYVEDRERRVDADRRQERMDALGITEEDIAITMPEPMPADMGHDVPFVNYDADDAEKDYDDHDT